MEKAVLEGKKPKFRPVSRAVVRSFAAGSASFRCDGCGQEVRRTYKGPKHYVVANVYVRRRWDRVEKFDLECYDGRYGPLLDTKGVLNGD